MSAKEKDVIEEQKCPACGAPMIFDPVSGQLLCEYCGTTIKIEKKADTPAGKKEKKEEETESLSGFDFSSLHEQTMKEGAEDVPIYSCKSCGAELIAPPQQIAMTCPYCGNNIVLTQKVSGSLRPDGIIPFKITPDILPKAVARFYKGKKLVPWGFFSKATMGEVTGVYVPFWLFSGNVSGEIRFQGEKAESTRRGDDEIVTTKYYALDRTVSMNFENLPVDASGRIDDALMDSLEPFHMQDAVPFDMRYLAGFTADRFDAPKTSVEERAKDRMFATADSAVRPYVGAGYSNVRRTGGALKASFDAKYFLFPVYLFSINHEYEKYEFAVNGQTGKVSGKLPVDKKVSVVYFLRFALILFLPVLLFFVLKYLLGL